MKLTEINDLRILWQSGAIGLLTDAELIERFVEKVDDGAFTVIVDRHGPMVLRVCKSILDDHHEAEDAWQATFLLLARHASSIRCGDSLGSWLFGVARRVALRARSDASRRAILMEKFARLTKKTAVEYCRSWSELHEEIDRLPASERAAVVACDLENLSHEAAAQRLDWSIRSVRKRLYRGRERLRGRLTRRGITLSSLVAIGSVARPLPASATTVLEMTRGAAIPLQIDILAKGVSKMMVSTSKRISIISVAGGAVLSMGYWAFGTPELPTFFKPLTTAKIVKENVATEETQTLLRRAAQAALALDREPKSSWALTTLANAQAEAGDREGAKSTFARALRDALAQPEPRAWDVWRIGHFQLQAGLPTEACVTLEKASELATKLGLEVKDRGFATFRVTAQDQLCSGDTKGVAKTSQRIKDFRARNPMRLEPFLNCDYAAALCAVGEVDEAFLEVENALSLTPESSYNATMTLGEMASTTTYLPPDIARPIVNRITERLAKFNLEAAEQVHTLTNLSQALARMGRFDEARTMASNIGIGRQRDQVDYTDTQPYALLLVAIEQDKTNDRAGAIETLRLALKIIEDSPNMRGRDGRYEQIITKLAEFGDLETARRFLKEVRPAFQCRILSKIALVERVKGDEQSAKSDFALAIKMAKEHPRFEEEKAIAARQLEQLEIAKILAMSGDYADARKTLTKVPGDNGALKNPSQLRSVEPQVYRNVAEGWAASGDLAGAVQFALGVESTANRLTAIEGVAQGYRTLKELQPSK